jgi:DNA-binding transcriptional ArsR family regulator
MDAVRKKEISEIMRACFGDECCMEHFTEIQEIGVKTRNDRNFLNLLDFLSVLGNKDRLLIIKTLNERGEQCVCELELLLDKSQPSISHHLRNLERIGLIRGWKKGKFTYYNLEKEKLQQYLGLFNNELHIE